MKTARRKIWEIVIAPIVALGLAAAMTAVQARVLEVFTLIRISPVF